MSETKWTPAPWSSDRHDVHSHADIEDGGDIICEAPLGWNESMRRWKANARLISAAPDLLEALEEALRWIGKLNDWEGAGDPEIEKWRAARDKAKGETR